MKGAARALGLALGLVLLAGCAPARPAAERVFFAMDTVMTLRVYAGGGGEALDRAQARVEELEGLWSVTEEGSEIYALNREGAAALSPETADLLGEALGLCRDTGGALNIALYPALRAWGFTTGEYKVPSRAELDALLPLADWAQVALEGNRAALAPGMEIDLGSVAKGRTGALLAAQLKEEGVASALLDLGGNIQAVGARPDGSPWRVGVRDPEGTDSLGVVEVIDQAVVTSGGYERYFEEDGVRYWHILDPETGAPARSGLVSVTVVGDDGALCDGLSTALFVMGREGALAFWREHGADWGFELALVEEDGGVTVTAGLEDRFTLVQTDRGLTVAD